MEPAEEPGQALGARSGHAKVHEPLLAGRTVNRRPVLPQAEPGHVDDVGHRGNLVDIHALGPARQCLVGQLAKERLGVDVSRERPHHLPELKNQLAPAPVAIGALHCGDSLADPATPLGFARRLAWRMLVCVSARRFVKRR